MTRLNVHRLGRPASTTDEVPILTIHGVRSHGRRLRRLAEETWPGRTTLAVDLRGHGDSTWDPPWDVATHVADLLETLDAEGVARVAVVGHSFGGCLAMHLAAAAPERVDRFALLDPAVALEPVRAAREAEETRVDEGWPTWEAARDARRADRPDHAKGVVDEDLAAHLREDPDGRWRFRYSRAAVIVAFSEMTRPPVSLAGYAGEGLLLEGLRGDYVTQALRSALDRDLGPRLTVRTLDVGHMVFWDAFESTAAIVAAFLVGAPVPAVDADGVTGATVPG